MENVTLRQLRSIIAVHRHGRIISAASELRLTQPAVTLQIKELELAAGTPLFDRTSEGMRPTAAGLAVIEAAHAVNDRLRQLADEIGAIRGVSRGALRFGVVSTAKYFAPSIIAAFQKAHPGVELTLRVGNREQIVAELRNHEVDIALMGRPPREVPVRATALGDHPLVIVAAADHPLAGARAITKEAIAGEHFLVRERGSGTRTALELFFGDVPSRTDHLGTEMGSNETIKQAVIAGLGIAFISAHTIAQELELRRLVLLDVEGLPIIRQWFSVARTDHAITPAMQAFEEFITTSGAGFFPRMPA